MAKARELREHAPRRPRGLSLRWQLTLSYAGFVLIVGVVFFAVGLLLLRFVPEGNLNLNNGGNTPIIPNRTDLLAVFQRYALWAIAALGGLGVGGGWLLSGRMLKPLDRITDAAQRVRNGELDHRIRMPGRTNELSTLADTFDGMAERIQESVSEHQRFAANASHELRTPLATIRAMLEVATAEGNRDPLLDRIVSMNERSITLTEALLSLARTGNALPDSTPVDLAKIASEVVHELENGATEARVTLSHALNTAPTRGTPALLTQLTTNLVHNAIVHNIAGGSIHITTSRLADGSAVLQVINTGPIIAPETAATLTEPFVRAAERTRAPNRAPTGVGLGLAIVASIVRAHSGHIDVRALPEGGLAVQVSLPSA